MTNEIVPQRYYRLPWTLTDNGISWLEVTSRCNLACEGCYRDKSEGHKSLEEIATDLAVFKQLRNSDCISIAGGDPLVHPQIVEIVRMISKKGWKPILNTNGVALDRELLHELKKAGVSGFTFHIDTSQKRKGVRARTEADLNPVRQFYAEMLAREGGLSCSFNQTVTSDTLDHIPEVVKWAQRHPDIVHTVVFILYREPRLFGEFEFYVHARQVNLAATYEKATAWGGDRALRAAEVAAKIQEVDPEYEPSACLNGTEDAATTKWLLATRIANKERGFGYVSPKFMEFVQQGHRLVHGTWLSYSHPKFLGTGRLSAALAGLFDKKMFAIAANIFFSDLRTPSSLLKKNYLQTFTIIQPIDVTSDGRMSMCDGCPDMTVYQGKLLWSCRLEEWKQFGCFVSAKPRKPRTDAVSGIGLAPRAPKSGREQIVV